MGHRRLLVTRHAESLEDIDKTAYERMADEDMPLSDAGREQARGFGVHLPPHLTNCEHLHIILSPSARVIETARIIVDQLPPHISYSLSREPLIVKQNWGDVTIHNRTAVEKERYRAGVLRYKFPGGEGGEELLDRFDLFKTKLRGRLDSNAKEDTLVITHGFELRVLFKTLLGWTEEYFESVAHPNNCELKRLIYDGGSFSLLDGMRISDPSNNPNFIRRENI